MGVVYLAVNEALDREVALKVLQTSFDEESEALARFRREAKLAARIEHPNVVGVYEVGKWQGRSFLAMQLVRGESLGDRLAREGALDSEEALRIIVRAAHGLAAAHTHGIIHRDIKPSNILLAGDAVKLADFGLARTGDPKDPQVTQEGRLMGTPEYMSPEQLSEQEPVMASDIYALGITWYLLLVGKSPFHDQATLFELALAHIKKPAPDVRESVPETPEAQALLIARMLSKDPAGRPRDAMALLAELEQMSLE